MLGVFRGPNMQVYVMREDGTRIAKSKKQTHNTAWVARMLHNYHSSYC